RGPLRPQDREVGRLERSARQLEQSPVQGEAVEHPPHDGVPAARVPLCRREVEDEGRPTRYAVEVAHLGEGQGRGHAEAPLTYLWPGPATVIWTSPGTPSGVDERAN